MFGSKANTNEIHKIQKQAFRTVYNNYDKFLEELLDIVAGTTIHTKHLQFLTTKVYKSLNQLNPAFMWKFFHIKNYKYELRFKVLLDIPSAYTKTYVINSVRFRVYLLWDTLQTKIKLCDNLETFKADIKFGKGEKCT